MSKRTAPSVDSGEFLSGLVGRWTGTAKTWFEPGAPARTAPISGHIYKVLKAQSIGHTYSTRLDGRTVQGMALIGRDLASSRVCLSWVDTFHTNADVMLCKRDDHALSRGFSVRGTYAVGPEEPPWGWRITYQLKGETGLEIVHYNITPGGHESLAVKIVYKRAGAAPGAARAKTPARQRVGAPRRSKK